ncbi:MAG: hypothetical protein H7A37_06755 [Chlamydiales bacterium]|nr:hypothetical protein [Chlamydiales bacterium]
MSQLEDLSEEERLALREKAPVHYLPYEEGKILIHDGLTLHQIAPAEKMQPDDERITLQGHALFCDGAWRLHW